jgi:hypothetical protein
MRFMCASSAAGERGVARACVVGVIVIPADLGALEITSRASFA